MKKLAVIFTALLCVSAFTTQAMAYFDDTTNLTMVLYNEGDNQVAIDLGSVYDYANSGLKNKELVGTGTVNLDGFGTAITMADLSVGIYAGETVDWAAYPPAGGDYFFATTLETSSGIWLSQEGQFSEANNKIRQLYYAESGNGTTMKTGGISASDINGYDYVMNDTSTDPGAYAGFAKDNGNEGQLANLAVDGYVDMYLYQYAYNFVSYDVDQVLGTDGNDYVAKIRIMDDGSVILNPEVPVPGSLILLSSGLLGLIGIRRKKA